MDSDSRPIIDPKDAAFKHNLRPTITEQDIKQYGELSSQNTVEQLQSIASATLHNFLAENSFDSVNTEALTSLAQYVERQFPFFFQGSGVTTLPRQLENYHAQPQPIDVLNQDIALQIKRNSDCKFPTSVLGFSLMELGRKLGENIYTKLLFYKRASHPSLLVRLPSGKSVKIDYETKLRKPYSEISKYQVLHPSITREWTYSFAVVKDLNEDDLKNYDSDLFLQMPLNVSALRKVDENFLPT